MTSFRAECVAEVLWELKKCEKVATYTEIAERAGFKAGVDGKAIVACIDAIKKDWPHLQWWRAVPDDCTFKRDCEQHQVLEAAGYTFAASKGRKTVVTFEEPMEVLFTWQEVPGTASVVA